MIERIKSKTSVQSINYQWDGLARFPETFNKLTSFDVNYVSDPNDVGTQNGISLLPATNF